LRVNTQWHRLCCGHIVTWQVSLKLADGQQAAETVSLAKNEDELCFGHGSCSILVYADVEAQQLHRYDGHLLASHSCALGFLGA
jgi:hypothetical protein